MPGCVLCLSVIPETNPKGLIELEVGQWEILCRCPKCGAYRWLTYETHGHAELPVWERPAREDILRFKTYLSQESTRRNLTVPALVEEIVAKCV